MRGRILFVVALIVVGAVSLGCDPKDDPSKVVPPSEGVAKPGAVFQYFSSYKRVANGERTVRVSGPSDFHGTQATIFAVENGANPNDKAFRVGVTEPGPTQIGLVGAEIFQNGAEPLVTLVGETPVVIDWGQAAGTSSMVPAVGTITVNGTPQSFDTAIEVKINEKDVTFETPRGPETGCIKASGDGNIAGNFHFEVVYKPGVGVLDAKGTHPLLRNERAGLLRSFNVNEDMETGHKRATSGGVIGGQYPGRFTLDTAQTAGKPDVDKDQHAKMWVELRWVDDARAKTSEQPSVTLEFGTILGRFDATLQQAPISLFHPEENGKGYTYWYALVDQAAKNESLNPIALHINVFAGSSAEGSELRADGQIRYATFTP